MVPLLIMAGVSLAGGLMSGSQNKRNAKADLAATKMSNLNTLIETAQQLNGIQVQALNLRDQAAQTRYAARKQAVQAHGSTAAAIASEGLRGASADALQDDIDRQLNEAEATMDYNEDIGFYNLSNSVRETIQRAKSGLRALPQVPSSAAIAFSAALQTAGTVGSAYAGSYFKFGGSGGTSTT